jgi:hypothetical protein
MAQKSCAERERIKVLLSKAARSSPHEIAMEPGSGNRQLQEKADGIDPGGLFSWSNVATTVMARA